MVALAEAYEAVVKGAPDGHALLAAAWASMRERQFYDAFEADLRARLVAVEPSGVFREPASFAYDLAYRRP